MPPFDPGNTIRVLLVSLRHLVFADIAQLVEHGSNKPRVGGSSPSWSIYRSYSVMVITKDSDSFNPGSSPGRTFLFGF